MYDPTKLVVDTASPDLDSEIFGLVMQYERIRDREAAKLNARIERTVVAILVAAKRGATKRNRDPRDIIGELEDNYTTNGVSVEAAAVLRAAESLDREVPCCSIVDAAVAFLSAEAALDSDSRVAAWDAYREAVCEARAWILATYLEPRLTAWIRSEPGRCLYNRGCFG